MTHHLLTKAAAAAALVFASGAAARAHAFLDRAEPGVGSTLAAPPSQVRILFTEALEPAFSAIAVTDAQGHHVEEGKARVDAGNPMMLEVGLAPLTPGTYTVRWRVISVDTHPTEGNFTFTVKP
jgi:methionine-rich copper-binding protein CopC